MFLTDLKVRNFKNIQSFESDFDNQISYFYSPNGTGKTNLLEAIQCLTVGKSLRSKTEKDILNLKRPERKVHVSGNLEDEDEISYKHDYLLLTEPRKKKELYINKNKTSINNFVGKAPSIWFSPESIKIISSSPASKRKYFDDILIQLFPDYFYHLRSYNRCLKQRNRILQSDRIDKEMIKVWTEQLIIHGAKIIKQRKEFFELVNEEFASLRQIKRYVFEIEPIPSVDLDDIFDEDPEFTFRSELQDAYRRDIEYGSTSVGPHKDNWELLIRILPSRSYVSAERFASRGQQRMGLILLQVTLINIFIKYKDIAPIMLLDDIFSELDAENEKILLKFLKTYNIQTFITGINKLDDKNIEQINLSKKLK